MEESLLQKGAHNAIAKYLAVESTDRVIIIGDTPSWDVDVALVEEAQKYTKDVLLLKIEDYGKRPLATFSDELQKKIQEFRPTVSVYAAQNYEGELPLFRGPLINLLTATLNCRHGHMLGVTRQVMEEGMCVDPTTIQQVTNTIEKKVTGAREIRVTDAFGTDITFILHPEWKWFPSKLHTEPGINWDNLPGAEVFTCPQAVEGKIVAWELGDYFAAKYGVLTEPVIFHITQGYCWNVESENKKILEEVKKYLFTDTLCNRVGEFSFGTNIGLTKLIGNFLQDEKFPGIHMAFGHSYPEKTGADWDAQRHLDILPQSINAWIDGKQLMENGKFLL